MKSFVVGVAVVVGCFAGPCPAASTDEPPGELNATQRPLLGNWLSVGRPGQQTYVASAGGRLFAIDERLNAFELFIGAEGALVARRGDEEHSGQLKGDVILWDRGSWWSRAPLPPPPDDALIWNDPGSGWLPLRTAGKSANTDGAEPSWVLDGPEAPRMGGRMYRRDQFLCAHAPSRWRFTFENPITEFRAVIGLIEGGRLGTVTFKVATDAGIVFTSREMTHAGNNVERVRLKFEPTRSLELITEAGVNNYEDWSNWLVPEVR